MPLEELHNWYHSVQDILLYNQQKLLSYTRYNILEKILEELRNGN